MKYTQPSFTLPASNNVNDIDWDLIFMSDNQFAKKHKITKSQFKKGLKKNEDGSYTLPLKAGKNGASIS